MPESAIKKIQGFPEQQVDLKVFIPRSFRTLDNPQTDIPRIARDVKLSSSGTKSPTLYTKPKATEEDFSEGLMSRTPHPDVFLCRGHCA
jgi:hypothetical protein